MEGAPLCVRTSVIVFPSIGNWPVFVCFGTLHIITKIYISAFVSIVFCHRYHWHRL